MSGFGEKLFKFLILLFVFEKCLSLNFNSNFKNITEMSLYLQHFSNEMLLKSLSELTVVQSVKNKRAKYFLNDVLDDYTKKLNHFKLTTKDVNLYYQSCFDYANVMLIDSYESFAKIDAGPISATQDYSEFYIIVFYSLNENPENEMQQIFDYCWQFYVVNVVVLLITEEETPIKLYTYYPFTQKSCKKAQMHIIKQAKSISELKTSDVFPNKLKRLYNCTLTAAVWNVPPYLILPPLDSGTQKIGGLEGFFLNVLSKVLEFKIDYIVPPNNEQRGLVKTGGRLTGALKMLKDRSADLSLGSFRCTLERSTILSPSMIFYQTKQVFSVLDLPQPWSSFEIIAFPFQFHIWLVLMLSIIFLLSAPLILKFYFPHVFRFICGFSSIYFINTNTVAITLSQNVRFVTKRNFSRFTIIMWILFTLVIRSVYQGALYKFLTTKSSKAPPDSVDDLIQRNYKLIVNVATNNTFADIPVIRDKLLEVIIMNITDDGGFPLLEANPGKSYVTGTPKDFLTYFVKTHNKNGVFHVVQETVFTQHLCIYFSKHSYLVYAFNKVLEKLGHSGLIQQWAVQLVNDYYLRKDKGASVKTPLTLAQLSSIFQICLMLYLLTIIVFVGEIVWFKLNRNNSL